MATTLAVLGAVLVAGCADDPADPTPTGGGLTALPPDSGGVHLALPRDPDVPSAAPYGCYLYLPDGLDESPVPYPLLIFLHGAGERGDSHEDPAVLTRVLRNGPPKLIQQDAWRPPYPMIVASPQCHDGWWSPSKIRELLEWLDANHPVDRAHVFLTGLSMGGFGTWAYLGAYGDPEDDPLPIRAAVPICGGGDPQQAAAIANTPVWAFHGTADPTVSVAASIAMIEAVGALEPAVPPRLTLYDGVGHDSWTRTYDGSGLDQGLLAYPEAPSIEPWLVTYSPDVWTWLFSR
jgi:predicted peptidase